MKKLFYLLIFILPLIKLTAQENFGQLLPVGQQAPDWELINSDGELKKLSDYKGNLILLDFWASWCAPCIRAQPMLESIHQDKDYVVVLGINVQEAQRLDLADYKKRNGLTYEMMRGSEDIVRNYRVEMLPIVYLIDPNGIILYAGFGYNERKKAEIHEIIKRNKI